MDNSEFEQQLALEAEEKAKRQQESSDPYTYTDPSDGTVYEWDHQKQAWFPKISEDFIASYQANYGSFEGTTPTPTAEDTEKSPAPPKKADLKPGEKRKAPEPAWFDVDDTHNTKVYVSGLPLDITEDEFAELMSKCGLIMKDPATNKLKLKLYRNSDGTLKGDGLCCYIKVESVDLSLKILDGYRLKNGEIHIERAKFQMKGEYDPSKKPRKKKGKEKEKLKKKMEKLFDWRPDKLRGERSRNEKTVIIKNMFDPKEFENDPRAILEYQQDIREECSKCGEVKKVVVYDRNAEGVASVTFKEAEEADECIHLMHGRWFAGRQLTAETWDGKTRYKTAETEEELEKRISQWDKFLDQEEDVNNQGRKNTTDGGVSHQEGASAIDHTPTKPNARTEVANTGVVGDGETREYVENERSHTCDKDDNAKVSGTRSGKTKATTSDYDEAALTDEERHSDQNSDDDMDEKCWP